MDHAIEWSKMKTDVQNTSFESDVEYAIKLNRWLLKPFGIWPLNSSSTKFDKGISVISPPICCLLLFFVMIPSFIEMFVSEKDFKARLEIVGPTSFIVMVAIKYFVFITRGEKLKLCVDTIINDWRNVQAKQEREIMIRSARIARFFTTICISFMFGGGVFYSTFLPMLTAKSLTRNNNLTIRLLPYHCNFILFDPYVRPVFDIVYYVHCLCTIITCSITTGVCSLAAKFVMHACGQCKNVILILQNLIDGDKCYASVEENKFAVVILRHLRVLRFVTNVENLLNEVCLVEFLGCTMNMCLLGYYFMTSWGNESALKLITLFFLWTSMTFNIFIFCYIGELLTYHCHQIGEASYMIDWYSLPGTQGRFLILLIGVANRPIRLTAGKIVQLSFVCFGNWCGVHSGSCEYYVEIPKEMISIGVATVVLKAAMTYLNILRTITT